MKHIYTYIPVHIMSVIPLNSSTITYTTVGHSHRRPQTDSLGVTEVICSDSRDDIVTTVRCGKINYPICTCRICGSCRRADMMINWCQGWDAISSGECFGTVYNGWINWITLPTIYWLHLSWLYGLGRAVFKKWYQTLI